MDSIGDKPVRVRFAPSPTGYLHVGGARTALYNFLVARKAKLNGDEKASFILRIEDTDAERNRPEWTEGIISSLKWLGIDWDEGPYFQSQRSDLYAKAADFLFNSGNAYWCSCTREDVDSRTKGSATPGYDRYCRERGVAKSQNSVLRFKVPLNGSTTVNDLVRGAVNVENKNIEDFVIQKSDGSPLFVLANVVDDIDLSINLVIRGEEHLPNTFKMALIFDALRALYSNSEATDSPTYAHLPLLVNEKRQKLSKRRDRVAVEDFKEQGFLPQAMINYLALLGWGPGDDREFMSLDELTELFELEKVNKAPAFFDEKKLRHFNGVYIRNLSDEVFSELSMPFFDKSGLRLDVEKWKIMVSVVKERVETLDDVPKMVDFLFLESVEIDENSKAKVLNQEKSAEILFLARESFGKATWDTDVLKNQMLVICEKLDLKLGKAQAPVRLAITGRLIGPPLFEALVALGRDATIRRLTSALEWFK